MDIYSIKHCDTSVRVVPDIKEIRVESVGTLPINSIMEGNVSITCEGEMINTENDLYTHFNQEGYSPNLSSYAYYNNISLGFLLIGKKNLEVAEEVVCFNRDIKDLNGCKIIAIGLNNYFEGIKNVVKSKLFSFTADSIRRLPQRSNPNRFHFDYVWTEIDEGYDISNLKEEKGFSILQNKYMVKSIADNRNLDLSSFDIL